MQNRPSAYLRGRAHDWIRRFLDSETIEKLTGDAPEWDESDLTGFLLTKLEEAGEKVAEDEVAALAVTMIVLLAAPVYEIVVGDPGGGGAQAFDTFDAAYNTPLESDVVDAYIVRHVRDECEAVAVWDWRQQVWLPAQMEARRPGVQLRLGVLGVEGGQPQVARFAVSQISVHVEQAFGQNARYKGRDVEPEVVLEPLNLIVETEIPAGMTLSELLHDMVREQLMGVNLAVSEVEAFERRKEATAFEEMLARDDAPVEQKEAF